MQQQRGSWIRLGVIFIFSYLYNQKRTAGVSVITLMKKYLWVFVAGIFLALLLTFTVQLRKFYSPDTSFVSQAAETIQAIRENPVLLVGGSALDEGNEYVVAYNTFMAAKISGIYDYGKKWLYPFMNFIPRTLWSDKPYWETYSINIFDYIDKYSIIRHVPGSAETGIMDTFFRFRWYSPLFFLILGFYAQTLQHRAIYNLRIRYFYLCFYIGSFYFFTQNMMPFVIFTLYMFIPVYVINRTCIKNAAGVFTVKNQKISSLLSEA